MCNITTTSAAVLIFILFDLATGLVAALKNREFKSAVMREGLFHKIGELAVFGFGILCDRLAPNIGVDLPVNITSAVASYLAIMEMGSILENISKLSPEAAKIFSKIIEKDGSK